MSAGEKYNYTTIGRGLKGAFIKAYDNGENPADDSDDDEPRFVKVPRTQEQLDAEKAALRATRKANKKEVREEKTEKRLTKIKKKDKKRAIKKAKAGNRKGVQAESC